MGSVQENISACRRELQRLNGLQAKATRILSTLNFMRSLVSRSLLSIADEQDRVAKIMAVGDNSIYMIDENMNTWIENVHHFSENDYIPGLTEILQLDNLSSDAITNRGSLKNELESFNEELKIVGQKIDGYKSSYASLLYDINYNIDAVDGAKKQINTNMHHTQEILNQLIEEENLRRAYQEKSDNG